MMPASTIPLDHDRARSHQPMLTLRTVQVHHLDADPAGGYVGTSRENDLVDGRIFLHVLEHGSDVADERPGRLHPPGTPTSRRAWG